MFDVHIVHYDVVMFSLVVSVVLCGWALLGAVVVVLMASVSVVARLFFIRLIVDFWGLFTGFLFLRPFHWVSPFLGQLFFDVHIASF